MERPNCKGTGSVTGPACDATGRERRLISLDEVCQVCNESGKLICPTCNGRGVLLKYTDAIYLLKLLSLRSRRNSDAAFDRQEEKVAEIFCSHSSDDPIIHCDETERRFWTVAS
jgi:hypothetical protein